MYPAALPSPTAVITSMTAQRAASPAPAVPPPPAPRSATRPRCSIPPGWPATGDRRKPLRSKRGARQSTRAMRPSARRRPWTTSTSAALSVRVWARPTAQSAPMSLTRRRPAPRPRRPPRLRRRTRIVRRRFSAACSQRRPGASAAASSSASRCAGLIAESTSERAPAPRIPAWSPRRPGP